MSGKQSSRSKIVLSAALIGILIVVAILAGTWLAGVRKSLSPPPEKPEKVAVPDTSAPVIDYNALGSDPELTERMQERKSQYGVQDGVDIIVKPDETIKIGDKTVSMAEILEKIRLHEGEIVEKDIQNGQNSDRTSPSEYGIHVVQPGENIWNIHFQMLKEFFLNRQISLSSRADEPVRGGYSSGVGKILKFSERMVYVYNLDEGRIDVDMHTIRPLNKIVVYNMNSVFSLLETIKPGHVDHVHFDGENLWIPAVSE